MAMSLPGRWTDDPVQSASPVPPKPASKPQRQFSEPNYSDPAVTQFCNEHLNDLDDLQNIGQLVASVKEQQTVVTTQVLHIILLN